MSISRFSWFLGLTLLLSSAGCSGRSYQVSSPVIGPVPPRIPGAMAVSQTPEPQDSLSDTGMATVRTGTASRTQQAADTGIVQASHVERLPIGMTEVIAEVNGEPILAHEVLDRYAPQLEKAKLQMRPEQIRRAQLEMIKKDLPTTIEQTLMVDALKLTMKPDQLKSVEAQLDKYFEGEVERLMKTANAGSPTELEAILQQQGMSLVTLRKTFGDRQLAGQFMRAKLGKEPTASREELRARYERDIDTYTEPEEVKWQQIDLSYETNGGIEGAEKAAQEILSQIRQGQTSFDAAAHDKSDSPLASSGGHSDWTNPQSLADSDVREALTTLPMNEASHVIPTKTACSIYMVTGRHEARVIPFNEVQKELHEKIVKEKKEAIANKVLDELKATAIIHTILDEVEAG